MLTKQDCLVLLTDLQDKGVDIGNNLNRLLTAKDLPLDVIKFINDNRPFEIASFYELLRKNYNTKKSTLYKNLVKEDFKEPTDCLTTLGSLNLQILLYDKKLEDEDKIMFLNNSRAEEITRVLNHYYRTFDLKPCITLLGLIKSDLKAFESVKSA